MTNEEKDILKEFIRLENKLIKQLNENKLDIDLENESSSVIKKELKAYIKNVNSINKTFEEYSFLATKLELLDNIDKKTTEKIVNLRENNKDENEIQVGDGEIKIIKKKKITKELSK